MPIPPLSGLDGALIACFSHLRWDWVYQRPQHILSRFARNGAVALVEEPWIDDRPPGLDVLAVAPGVTVVRPHRPAGSDFDLDALVDEHLAAIRRGRPLVRWFYSPMFAAAGSGRLDDDAAVVFDCMDELALFAGAPAGLRDAEARLMARADVVFTGGRSLHEARRGRHPNIHCFPSAVDADHFAAALDPALPAAADLDGLPRPIFGYCGVVDERLDYDLIARLADGAGGGSVVLVGPWIKVDRDHLPARGNLHYLGQRAYADLPAYMKGFDVCLMPWALNDATRRISPTKTLEYMAAGRPIVSTAVADVVRDHGDLVRVAGSADEFVALALAAAAHADPDRIAAGLRRAQEQSWDGVARSMAALIRPHLRGKAGSPRKRAPKSDDAANLIVGAGPAGLSAAYHLEDPDFLLADNHSRPGGLCRSIIRDGFTFDYAGHIFFTPDPDVDRLFREVLGSNFHEQRRESWVYLYDAYQRYPFQGNLHGLPPAVLKECLMGVIEATRRGERRDNGEAPEAPPAHFLEWSLRTFGPGITRHFMQPYNFKVWGIDPAAMSSDWIAGRVLTPSLDDVIGGAIAPGKGEDGPNARFGYPLRGGCESFVAGFAQKVRARGGAMASRRTLVRVDPRRKRATFRVDEPGGSARHETRSYRTLYPSVPLPDLIRAIDGAPDAVRRAAEALPSTAVVCVNLGIDRARVTEKHWIYYPEGQDKFLFQRIFVQSNASPLAAPEGHSALTFEISHSAAKPLPVRGKKALVAACVAGLQRTDLWQDGDNVVFEQVLGLPHAYIPFTPARQGLLDTINAYLHPLDIHPIGRFGEWKYLNQDGAILSGRRVVRSVEAGEPVRRERDRTPAVGANGSARPVTSS